MALTPAERVRRWRAKKKQLQKEAVKEPVKEEIVRTETVREIVKEESKDELEGGITEIIYMLPPKQASILRLRLNIPLSIDWTDYNSSNYLITF
jgi:hypothetical protein